MRTSISTPTAEHQTQPAQPGTIRTAAELTIETGHITVERYQVDEDSDPFTFIELTLSAADFDSDGQISLTASEARRLASALLALTDDADEPAA